MKEADLYEPLKRWLKSQGCTKVVPEVPFLYRPIDGVGTAENLVIGVEMKLSLTKGVIHQATTVQLGCDRTYVAVRTRPRDPERAGRHGLGLLRISGDSVEVLLEPKQDTPLVSYKQQLLRVCSQMSEEGVGGVPCLEGVGPAQDCKRRVDEYRKTHPEASWRELFEKIPNHYATHNSMRQSLTTGMAQREHWKKLRKEGKI